MLIVLWKFCLVPVLLFNKYFGFGVRFVCLLAYLLLYMSDYVGLKKGGFSCYLCFLLIFAATSPCSEWIEALSCSPCR